MVADAVEVQQQAPDRVGRAAAVIHQFGLVGVTGLVHVLLKSAEQVAQQGQGQLPLADLRGQGVKHSGPAAGCGLALCAGSQIGFVERQVLRSLGGAGLAFVGQVVGGAGEVVNGHHGRPQMRWTQDGGDRKVFVMVYSIAVY